jgi:hypothetical protein
MRVVPERSPWAQLATVLACFFVGPFAGLRLGLRLAPESDLAQTVGVFALASVFVGGMVVWMGLGVVVVVGSGLLNLIRGRRPGPATLRATERLVPPGYRSFVILGVSLGAASGLLAGLVTPLGVGAAVLAWSALGTAYGVLLWAAAHYGWLPFPEPE